mgnify:CR=1 FL=1
MDLKIVFLLILGITTSILIYKIIYHKLYGVEGFIKELGKKVKKAVPDPLEGIKKTINFIVNGVNAVLCFLIFMIDVFEWTANTVVATFALFIPPCPIFHIIDIIIAFIGFTLGSLLRLLRLDMLIDAFSAGRDGIDYLTNATLGVEITDFHKWMGIKSLCYNPKFAFKPFPKYTPPKIK